jgi:hypothetical protein
LILDIPISTGAPNSKSSIAAAEIFELHDRSQPRPPKKPKVQKSSKLVRGGTRGHGTRPGRRKKVATPDQEDGEEEQAAQNEDADVARASPSDITAPRSLNTKKATAVDPDKIQILGLHTDEPVISYDGNIYSCRWTTSIGTDLLFKKHNGHTEPDQRYLESLGSWDLIGLGAATLVASPATLHPRRHGTPDIHQMDDNAALGTGLNSMQVEEGSAQQGDFLRRLADIKRWKGEANQHTLTSLQGTTTADGRPIAPLRGRGRGGRRPRVAAPNTRAPDPRTPSASVAPAASDERVQAQDMLSQISTPTPNTWDTFESPPIHRAPPPVFAGFPEHNLREETLGEVAQNAPGPSLAELLRDAALGNKES